jgi:transcriptional regulator with PAS, ATPase and Fis domain
MLLDLAIDPILRRIAQHVQETWGLWVGLVAGNEVVPFTSRTPLSLPFCERLLATPEQSLLCGASVRQFGHPGETQCHKGLGALVAPISNARGRRLASVYVSGFLAQEEGSKVWEQLSSDYSEDLLKTIPVLNRRQRDTIQSLLTLMASIASDRLAEMEEPPEATGYGEIIGTSEPMQRLFKQLRQVSRTHSTVLIRGENGTGKELIARAIHRDSARSKLPFIAQNIAAIPGELMESELFGHRKGAFSGAHRDRTGLFEAAHRGTFFLDEIGEMNISLQVKLLRILQEGTFLPVGDTVFQKVDVRIICATNRDLETAVAQGAFRQDLYYRINVVALTAPPLRHRREDIGPLAQHFAKRAAYHHGLTPKTLTPGAISRLEDHSWPGNVRELENEIERMVILAGDADTIEENDVHLRVKTRNNTLDVFATDVPMPDAVEELERKMILEVLRRTRWNKSQTARELGVSRRNLIRKIAAFGLDEERYT